ncbi:hypothetical protein BGX34_010342 [Mortierella sp. NVP85]|nr:hypothetical protein BGX34_010342 [Mortierella sp. NVP85]
MLAVRQTLPAPQEQGATELLNHGGASLRHTASQGRVFARALGDEQMLGDGSNPPSPELSLVQLGRIFAWICTLFYLSSRMPQLWKNFKRKSVKGLSILMFFWAVMGNLTYTLSILYSATVVNPDTRHKALQEFLPYLLGSSGTLIFDISIFGQWLYYTGRLGIFGLRPKSHRSRHRHRHHHHSRLRSSRSTPNRSRAESMVLSPSGSQSAIYSILVDEDDAEADPPHPLESAQTQSMENMTLDEPGHERREEE